MKHVITVKSKHASMSAPIITMQTRVKTPRNEELYETLLLEGNNVYREIKGRPKDVFTPPTAGQTVQESAKVATITLNLIIGAGSGQKMWYDEFVYYDEEEEMKAAGVSKEQNNSTKTLLTFLKKHWAVCVKDKDGKETNPNINPTLAAYDFIDKTERLQEKVDVKMFSIEARMQLREWFLEDKKDPVMLKKFAYLWGVQDISGYSPEKLFDYLTDKVAEDMNKYNATIKHIEDEIRINVLKGTQIKGSDNNLIIQRQSNQYVFNTILVGKDIDEVVQFFTLKSNTQQYLLLKNELGVKDIVPQFELPLAPKEYTDGLKVEQKHPSQVRKEEKEITYLKNKFSDKIKRVIVNKQDVTSPKNGNFWKKLEETNKSELQCLVELADDPELRDNSELQTWFQNEIEVIRNENK
jgi:hypothetical protein